MDSAAINLLLRTSVCLGFTRLLQKERVRVAARWLFQQLSRLPGSKDAVCALAEVQGPKGTWRASLTSHRESKTTTLCALPIVEALYEGKLAQSGVWLPEQIIDPTVYLQALTDLGLEI